MDTKKGIEWEKKGYRGDLYKYKVILTVPLLDRHAFYLRKYPTIERYFYVLA